MKKQIAAFLLGVALAISSAHAQEADRIPKLSEAQKTVVKLLQAELQNAQLTVQLLLTRAQAAQVQRQAKQAQLDTEVLRLHMIKEAPVEDFDFNRETLTFTKRATKKNE